MTVNFHPAKNSPRVDVITLSLCIATLNRARFIGATLTSIVSQLPPDVEVIVLDGGSSDATEEVVGAHAAGRDNVRYIREPAGSGLDIDFDKAVAHARGQYCWLLGDDDLLRPGAIERILAACRAGHVLIVANAEVRSTDLSVSLNAKRLPYAQDHVYAAADVDRLFEETAYHLTFIGAAVIRRDMWMARDRKAYFGTEFIHVGVIFQAPLSGSALVVAEPQVMIRYGNAHWTGRAFEIWMVNWPNLVWSFASVGEAAKRAVIEREPWRILQNLLMFRAKGAYGRSQYTRLLRPRLGRLARFWPSFISLMPAVLANFVCVVGVQLLSPRSKGTLFDLYGSPHWIGNIVGKH